MMDLPRNVTVNHLQLICNSLLKQDETVPYAFFVDDKEITNNLDESVFKVQPITKCTSSLPGHAEAVISVQFSPDSRKLTSGSGLKNWVLCIAWSPNSKYLVSGCKNGMIMSWNVETGKWVGPPMTGHKQ
ncbi:hypothetical protein QTP88_002859 [Uroleucon formosanum]